MGQGEGWGPSTVVGTNQKCYVVIAPFFFCSFLATPVQELHTRNSTLFLVSSFRSGFQTPVCLSNAGKDYKWATIPRTLLLPADWGSPRPAGGPPANALSPPRRNVSSLKFYRSSCESSVTDVCCVLLHIRIVFSLRFKIQWSYFTRIQYEQEITLGGKTCC